MAVKVMWGPEGPYAIAETPAEAIELIRLGSNGSVSGIKGDAANRVAGTRDSVEGRVMQVFSEINDRARAFLVGLSRHPSGVRSEMLAQEIKEESRHAFGGVLGGVTKIAKNYELSLEDFVISEMRIQGSERFRFFKPGELLLNYAEKIRG